MGNCQEMCYSPPPPTDLPLHEHKKIQQHPSEISGEQFNVKCELCGVQKKNAFLQKHLDLCHFVYVREKNSGEFEVTCLICEFKSASLPQHKAHLSSRHSYMKQTTAQNMKLEESKANVESNQLLKSRIGQANKNNIKMQSDGKSCLIANELFDIYEYNGQYGAMEFNEDIVRGELVWRNIFGDRRAASFYSLEFVPKMKSIQGKAKVFVKRGKQ